MPAYVERRGGNDYGFDVTVDGANEWFASDKEAYTVAEKISSMERHGGRVTKDGHYGWKIDGNRWIGSLKGL
ncbi:MAG: hypothetical protein UR66_C0002G0015 [Candidatus Moranbacteria bacterium GW2011_GWE1_35_17]|nr:MAG: hypothetical protein UR66_C0002G0015 [Candidatus Moranbacteria bacterium GW2011_GWE1_35_17]KKP83800.1 MAG: hypothetical protein UR82_C0018G0017 [Candidatus Moranbacteria bacterium GW2011_GWF1_35_5]KKP84626.1 MAG: hypothetical protein UR83_C0017G0022 [Candidatus Moranbacteria bacterium GW2011_GWF2_35_54]